MDGREIDESRLNENRVEGETRLDKLLFLRQTSQACMRMATARVLRAFRHAGWLVGRGLPGVVCLLALVFVGVCVVFGGLFYLFSVT